MSDEGFKDWANLSRLETDAVGVNNRCPQLLEHGRRSTDRAKPRK